MISHNTCRYCSQPVAEPDSAITHSYWQGLPFVCHKSCKDQGRRDEAFECQCIDADCNDCKHYRRGKLAPLQREKAWTQKGWTEVTFQPNLFVDGWCNKLNQPTLAQPNKWTGHECFEHRRS